MSKTIGRRMTLEAGVDIPIQALWIKGGRIQFKRQDSDIVEQYRLVHDAFFIGVKDVEYHADSGEITCMGNCVMVIEGFLNYGVGDVRVDRVSFVIREG